MCSNALVKRATGVSPALWSRSKEFPPQLNSFECGNLVGQPTATAHKQGLIRLRAAKSHWLSAIRTRRAANERLYRRLVLHLRSLEVQAGAQVAP
jgi:hypothetical protein